MKTFFVTIEVEFEDGADASYVEATVRLKLDGYPFYKRVVGATEVDVSARTGIEEQMAMVGLVKQSFNRVFGEKK